MIQEEILKDLRKRCSECITKNIFQNCNRNCEIWDFIAQIENINKYHWHDLRKNPDDLPPIGTSVLIYDNNEFNNVMLYEGKLEEYEGADVWVDCNASIQLNIIAWKYIEPFKEDIE